MGPACAPHSQVVTTGPGRWTPNRPRCSRSRGADGNCLPRASSPSFSATWSEGAGLQFFLLFLVTCSALTEERRPSPSPLRTESGSLSWAPGSRRCQGVPASRTLGPNQQDPARPEPHPHPGSEHWAQPHALRGSVSSPVRGRSRTGGRASSASGLLKLGTNGCQCRRGSGRSLAPLGAHGPAFAHQPIPCDLEVLAVSAEAQTDSGRTRGREASRKEPGTLVPALPSSCRSWT